METNDLLLRNWQDTDAEPLYKLCLDPALRASGIHSEYHPALEKQQGLSSNH